MKRKSLLLAIPLIMLSCKAKKRETIHPKFPNQYKYEISGYVPTKGGMHEAMFYTDTFYQTEYGLGYTNSDGSVTKIYSPYCVSHIKNK
jgi:hypothetical protein